METLITILAAGWLGVLLSQGIESAWLDRLRDLGKPFSCAKCMGFWLGALAALPLLAPLAVLTTALASSAAAALLEKNTKNF